MGRTQSEIFANYFAGQLLLCNFEVFEGLSIFDLGCHS